MVIRLPERFLDAVLSSLDVEQMKDVLSYARAPSDSRGLMLMGKPGLGKSFALAALTRAYAEKGIGSYEFSTAPDVFDRLSGFDKPWDKYRNQTWKKTYRNVRWLVINDLGKESRMGKLGDQVPHVLGRLLRARSEKCLVVHITTNLTLEDLSEAYGDSVTSLLSEMVEPVEITGADRRERKDG